MSEDLLTWAPPGYPDYVGFATHEINAPTTFLDFGDTPTIVQQNVVLTERLVLRSNTDVVWIGGEWNVDSTVNGPDALGREVMVILPSSSGTPIDGRIVHLEGIFADGYYLAGDVHIADEGVIVQMQNMRWNIGMWAKNRAGSPQHPDTFQPYGGAKEIRVDKCTGVLTYQGFIIGYDAGASPPGHTGPVTIKRTNFKAQTDLANTELGESPDPTNDTINYFVHCSRYFDVANDPNALITLDRFSFQSVRKELTPGGTGTAGLGRASPYDGWTYTVATEGTRDYLEFDTNRWSGKLYEGLPFSPGNVDWCAAGTPGLTYASPGYVGFGGTNQVTLDSVGPNSGGTAGTQVTTLSWAHTCAGTNRALYVGVSYEKEQFAVTATYDGISLTEIGQRNSNDQTQGGVSLFELVNPPVGTATVEVSIAGASDMVGGSVSFNNVDQTTPSGTLVSAISSSNSVSATLTPPPGSMVIDTVCCGGAIDNSNSTLRWLRNLNTLSGAGNAAQSTRIGDGTQVTQTYSRGAVEWWALLAVPILPSGVTQVLPNDLLTTVEISKPTILSGPIQIRSLEVQPVISRPTVSLTGTIPVIPVVYKKPESDEARRALIHSMDLDFNYTVKVLDEFDTEIVDITDKVFSCKITHQNFVTVHRRCDIETSSGFRYGRDRIKVEITIFSEMLALRDTIPLGVFIPTWPEHSRMSTNETVCYDKIWLLDHTLANHISLVENQPIIASVQDILKARNIYEDEIDLSRASDVMSTVRSWNADDEANKYSTVINEILGMVGYRGIYMTGDGKAKSGPYVAPEFQPLAWKYSAGEIDNIIDANDEGNYSTNQTDIPNRWRFYNNANDQRDTPPTEGDGYFFFDNKTDGPSSQDALGGLVIPKTLGLDASSQTDLEAKGFQIISEDIRANESARFTTFLNPYHGHFDVLNLQEHLLGAVGRFQHISWELDLDSGTVIHEVRRVQGGII